MSKYIDKEKILELYKTGKYTQQQIANECGCSRDTVYRTLVKSNLLQTKLSPPILKIKDEVIACFKDGMYCKDIAKKYNIGECTVYKILDIANIKRQPGYHSNCVEDYFENIDNPHKSYLLGFVTADGAVVKDVLSIEIHKKDIGLLNYAKQQINPKATITECNYKEKNNVRISFGAKKIGRDLEKYGVVQNKSKIIKKVPLALIPKDLLPFYFRGLIDGDGCAHKNGAISIYSGSKSFIESVQRILCEEAKLTKLKIYKGTSYFITWSNEEDRIKLYNYLYKDLDACFYYSRKYERLLNSINKYADTEVSNQIA